MCYFVEWKYLHKSRSSEPGRLNLTRGKKKITAFHLARDTMNKVARDTMSKVKIQLKDGGNSQRVNIQYREFLQIIRKDKRSQRKMGAEREQALHRRGITAAVKRHSVSLRTDPEIHVEATPNICLSLSEVSSVPRWCGCGERATHTPLVSV